MDKFQGCLIGFAIGDAIGSPLEFSERDDLCQFTEMENNYHYNLPAGHWTDKTSQVLCLVHSLIENRDLICDDFLCKYHQLITIGTLAPLDRPFESTQYMKITALKIGLLMKYKRSIPPVLNPNDYHQIDCEPFFRIPGVILSYYSQPSKCVQYIEKITQSTHISKICIDACQWYGSLMIGALMGVSKERLLSDQFNIMDVTTYGTLKYNKITRNYLENCTDIILNETTGNQVICKSTKKKQFLRNLIPPISKIQKGSYKNKTRNQIHSDNNIVHCLEAALWAFYSTSNFENGCILAINLGFNSNAIGAIYGQLAGVYYGFSQIPQRWISKLHQFPHLYELSRHLNQLNSN